MDNYANESVLLFGDEKLTAIYQDIVTKYRGMIQLSGRYELCPYQYAYIIMAAMVEDANVGVSKSDDNHPDTEMVLLHDGMPEYADVVSYIIEHVREPLTTHILSVVSKEFTDLWCGSIWYTNISLVEIDGTYEKPVFEFASASRDTESAFRYCRRYYNYIHTAIPNNKIHYQLTTDDI